MSVLAFDRSCFSIPWIKKAPLAVSIHLTANMIIMVVNSLHSLTKSR